MLKSILLSIALLSSASAFADTVTVETGGSSCPMYISLNDESQFIDICQVPKIAYSGSSVVLYRADGQYSITSMSIDVFESDVLPYLPIANKPEQLPQ